MRLSPRGRFSATGHFIPFCDSYRCVSVGKRGPVMFPPFRQLVLIDVFYIRLVRERVTAVVFTSVKLQGRRSESCTTEVSAFIRQSDCGRTRYGQSPGPIERAGAIIER